VHRICATLLVAVFSFTLINPSAFLSRAEQKLPACCRSNGKHHCAMNGQDTSTAPAFRAGYCASFGVDQTISPVPGIVTIEPSQATFVAVVSQPVARPQVEALGSVSFDRSRQKRGPPAA
jgi:hypothetical protein